MISRATVIACWGGAVLVGLAAALVALLPRPALQSASVEESLGAIEEATPLEVSMRPALVMGDIYAPTGQLLSRSAFDPERRAFQRTPQAAEHEVEVPPPRLLGIFERGGERTAMVEWPATGDTQELSVGDETPIGRVAAIEASQILLKSGDNERAVQMFD